MDKIKISEIIEIKKGEYITRAEANEGIYPVILGGKEPAYYIDKYNHTGKAIVISRSGASAGHVSFWNGPIFITDGFIIEPKSGTHFEYVYYLLKSHQRSFQKLQGGSAIPHVTPKTINSIKVLLPPLDSQIKIANILIKYDNLIETNINRINILEQMADNLFQEWFARFRFPGFDATKIENGIPNQWTYITVEKLAEILQRGISPDYDNEGNSTVISQKCIRGSIMDISEARMQRKPFRTELNIQDCDTVICSTGTGTLGRVGQVYGEYPHTTFDSHVTLVRAKEGVGKHFLYWTLKNMQPWFMSMGIGSTNQQELYRKTIKNAKVLLPDESSNLIEKFEGFVEPIHKQICSLRDENQNLIKQRDLLLPRLMSGKLEV